MNDWLQNEKLAPLEKKKGHLIKSSPENNRNLPTCFGNFWENLKKLLCFSLFNFRAMYIPACVGLGFVSIGKLEI